jgi:two-component system response regulator HydG
MKEPGASVLVVDDNTDLLKTFSLILRHKGYNVDTAGDGLAAVDKFKTRHFDVILMDVVMPGLNGVEAFRRMKEIDPETKVILMTAYYDDDELKAARDEGAFHTVNKPIDIARLMGLIKEATVSPPILIVDDDGDFRKTMARLLELQGYRVDVAGSGEEAIQIAQAKTCQLAFVDVKLPFMDGLQTYLKLKEINPNIIAIMMTGYGEEVRDVIEGALAASALTCLYKPFQPAEVVALVNQFKGKRCDEGKREHISSGR